MTEEQLPPLPGGTGEVEEIDKSEPATEQVVMESTEE